MREIINAILYLERSGCQWDMLPHDLPPKRWSHTSGTTSCFFPRRAVCYLA
jgi:transposase